METTILLIFGVVYLGMILGGLPFLQLDRTGIALLGAIALIGVGALSLEEAWEAVHVPTLILLFAFMVVSAQLRLGGFYTWVTHKTGHLPLSPPKLLAALIAIVAALSAIFSNDVICLAMAPVLIDACLARRFNPVPYLLALASTLAGNLLIVGSIANIIVVDAAGRRGVLIDWKRHARTGVPVTLATMAISWGYLWLRVLH